MGRGEGNRVGGSNPGMKDTVGRWLVGNGAVGGNHDDEAPWGQQRKEPVGDEEGAGR